MIFGRLKVGIPLLIYRIYLLFLINNGHSMIILSLIFMKLYNIGTIYTYNIIIIITLR